MLKESFTEDMRVAWHWLWVWLTESMYVVEQVHPCVRLRRDSG